MSTPITVTTTVTTVDGKTHTGPANTGTREDLNSVHAVLREFPKMNYLSLVLGDGTVRFFNPRHIISVTTETKEA